MSQSPIVTAVGNSRLYFTKLSRDSRAKTAWTLRSNRQCTPEAVHDSLERVVSEEEAKRRQARSNMCDTRLNQKPIQYSADSDFGMYH